MALEVQGQLPTFELLAAVGQLGLSVGNPSSRDQLVAALTTASVDSLTTLFSGYKRERLKERCRALGLDDSGKEKVERIARLLTASPLRTRQLGLGIEKESSKTTHIAEPTHDELAQQVHAAQAAEKLTREQLERYLWAAADILRGSIDSSDYKSFIFGLLLRTAGIDPEDRDEHQFFVPPEARWQRLLRATTGLGEVLNIAAAKPVESNASLEGVLGGIDYNDQNKLGDAKQRDTTLYIQRT